MLLYVIEMRNTGNKMKSNDYFSILEKTFVAFCDDVINDDVV